jgi:hypothetical protein
LPAPDLPTGTRMHYSIMSLLPLPSNYGFGMPLGWLRMFYIDPHDFLTSKDA